MSEKDFESSPEQAPSLDARGRIEAELRSSGCVGDVSLLASRLASIWPASDALREAMVLLRLVRCCAGQDPLTTCTMFKAVNAWRRKNDPEWRAPDGSAAPTAPKGPQR